MKTLCFLLLLLNSLLALAAQITVETDRNPVHLNESFQLTFTANETPDGNPDFSPLTQDFDILNQSHTSQSSWINGKRSATIQWTLQMMAKQAGSLLIPAISFGQDKTEAMTIMVTTTSSTPDIKTNEDLLLKVDATPLNPYVQSQVIYTLRFYRRINIAQARLDDPKLSDAVIQKLGDDNTYNSKINGVDYVVTERKYAIFPQKSGKITIPPLTLTAEVVADSLPRFNGFFNQQATRTKKIASNTLTLDVRPAPATEASKAWLPAEELQISQEWSGDTAHMKVGEPLTRTLTLIAKGATVGLLPELFDTSKAIPQLKTYPDQPTLKEMPKAEGVYAMREEKIALIPSAAGTVTLPAIEIPWFNTKTQQAEIAKIPATTLTVQGAATQGTPVASPTTQPVPTLTPVPISSSESASTPNVPQMSGYWPWLAGFFGLGWLATLVYFLRKPRPPKASPKTSSASATANTLTTTLKQACQGNNPQLAKQVLLQWGSAAFKVHSLGALAEQCDVPLRDEILKLNQVLYAPVNAIPDWNGKLLFQEYSDFLDTHKTHQKPKNDALEPLHRL